MAPLLVKAKIVMKNKKIVLHCGAPKTGSTSLQNYLYDESHFLEERGVFILKRMIQKNDVDPLFRLLLASRKTDAKKDSIIDARSRVAALLVDPKISTLLISYESILGEPFEYDNPVFFPKAPQAVRALKEIFRDYDTEVHYVTRDYAGFISSYYVQHIRRGGDCSLKDFVHAIDPDTLSWTRIVDLLRSTFGAENVHVHEYRDFLSNPGRITAAILSDLIPEDQVTDKIGMYQKNRSAGGFPLYMARIFNKILVKGLSLPPQTAGRITRQRILKPLSRFIPSGKPRIEADMSEFLTERYHKDLEILFSTSGH